MMFQPGENGGSRGTGMKNAKDVNQSLDAKFALLRIFRTLICQNDAVVRAKVGVTNGMVLWLGESGPVRIFGQGPPLVMDVCGSI